MVENISDTEYNSSFSSNSSFDVEDDVIIRAYDLYQTQRYDEAISLVQNNMSIIETSKAQVLVGNCHLQLKNYDNAVKHWKKAIEISPLEQYAYVNLANYYYSIGKVYDAIHNWSVATTIVPENPTTNLNLALAYDKINSRIKATKYFEKFLKYETNQNSPEYQHVKQRLLNMTAKVDFYTKKLQEFKDQRDIKSIAALYLKIVSTYALVPPIYSNIADIFVFDKNYEKALEFYQVVYLYFPYTNKILIEMGNLCFMLKHLSYAYVYYTRALETLPEGTSHHAKVTALLKSLESVKNDTELVQSHFDKAKEAEAKCDYEVAIDEYENYMILTSSESEEIQQIIDKCKIFVSPEPFVTSVLYSQIPELMNKKKLEPCIELCDRIITLANEHSKEVVAAIKYKSECKSILAARNKL